MNQIQSYGKKDLKRGRKMKCTICKNGETQSTKAHRPYELKTYITMPTSDKARKLEKYFKSGSGKTILKKRILADEDIAEYEVQSDA